MASKRKIKTRVAKSKTKRRKPAKIRKIGPPYAPVSSRELLPPIPSPV